MVGTTVPRPWQVVAKAEARRCHGRGNKRESTMLVGEKEGAGRGKASTHGQCTVFGSFHQFALTRSLVIDTAKVQNAVNNDAV